MSKSRKILDFDLRVDDLKRVFGEPSHTIGYAKIERYLKSVGFLHDQGSGYISKNPMSEKEIIAIIHSFHEKLPWFLECVDDFRYGNAPKRNDAKQILSEYVATLEDNENINVEDFQEDLFDNDFTL